MHFGKLLFTQYLKNVVPVVLYTEKGRCICATIKEVSQLDYKNMFPV